jgi:hypothetical protein
MQGIINIFGFMFLVLLLSCETVRYCHKVKLRPYRNGNKISILIPRNSTKEIIRGGLETTEYYFRFPDSSVFYINDINSLGYRGSNLVTDHLHWIRDSSFEVSGIDTLGFYWKNYRYKGYNIGYYHTRKERLCDFDKSLMTFKIGG